MILPHPSTLKRALVPAPQLHVLNTKCACACGYMCVRQNARSVGLYGSLASPVLRTRGLGELLLRRLLASSGGGCRAGAGGGGGGGGGCRTGTADAATSAAAGAALGTAPSTTTYDRSTAGDASVGGGGGGGRHTGGGPVMVMASTAAGGPVGWGADVWGSGDAEAGAALLQLLLAVSAGQVGR